MTKNLENLASSPHDEINVIKEHTVLAEKEKWDAKVSAIAFIATATPFLGMAMTVHPACILLAAPFAGGAALHAPAFIKWMKAPKGGGIEEE